jgi:hypothetical protein
VRKTSPRKLKEDKALVPISYYVALSAILFGLGVVGFIFKRNS